jgi:hypothetical protein
MPGRSARESRHVVNVDGYDRIEVSSIDSFPASDPPGWIEAKARPCEDALSDQDAESKADQSRPKRSRA